MLDDHYPRQNTVARLFRALKHSLTLLKYVTPYDAAAVCIFNILSCRTTDGTHGQLHVPGVPRIYPSYTSYGTIEEETGHRLEFR